MGMTNEEQDRKWQKYKEKKKRKGITEFKGSDQKRIKRGLCFGKRHVI